MVSITQNIPALASNPFFTSTSPSARIVLAIAPLDARSLGLSVVLGLKKRLIKLGLLTRTGSWRGVLYTSSGSSMIKD
jgi:hypothetical protein